MRSHLLGMDADAFIDHLSVTTTCFLLFSDEFYVDVEEEDELDDDEMQDDMDDEDGEEAIDLNTFLQAISNGTADGTDEQATRTARVLNGIGLQGLRRLLGTGRIQIRRAVNEDEDEDEIDEVGRDV